MEQNETIGTLLKNFREQKNISIDDVCNKTKININILKALEEDDLSNLPNKTYVRGFVVNYAKTIGLDVNEARNSLENTYDIKYGDGLSEPKPVNDSPEEEEDPQEVKEALISIVQGFFNKKIMYSLAGLIVFVIIGKAVIGFFTQLNFESKTIESKTNIVKAEPKLKSKDANIFEMEASKKLASQVTAEATKKKELKKIAVVKKPIEKKQVVAKPVPTPIEKVKKEEPIVEKKKVVFDLPRGKFPYKKFYPTPKKMFELVKDSKEAQDTALLPSNIKASVITGKQNVYIVATDQDTWISYKIDDQKIKRYVLKQGRRVLIKGDRVLLFMGNFNATKVFLNNKLVSSYTKTGVKSLIFPNDVANEYELPLFPAYKGIPYSADDYRANMVPETKQE